MKTNSLLISAALGGLLMALLSDLPIISIVNCILCAGIWGSGILAVLIYRNLEKTSPDLTISQGATLGGLAGIVGAIISSLLSIVFSGASVAASMDALRSNPAMADALNNVPSWVFSTGAGFVSSLLCNLIFYIIFGAIGGLIATSLIWKKKTA
jgi:hypothetical protein